jgi:lantibiotic transport system ATP-binding protein
MLNVKKLSVFVRNVPLLDEVSLSIKASEILFLIGPNGAGKTTLLRAVLGLTKSEGAQITINGLEMNRANRPVILKSVGVLVEQSSFYKHLSVEDNLAIMGAYYDVPYANIAKTIEITGLEGETGKKADLLSSGMKQRLSLAMALIHQPTLLLLDEPTSNLDPQAIVEFRNLILQLRQDLGIAFLITSHLLSEVERTATHVAFIRQGKIIETLEMAGFSTNYGTLEQYYMAKMTQQA